MTYLAWSNEFNIGIQVIDNQHKRIVEMINKLDAAQKEQKKEVVQSVIQDLVDYTLSHFTFEETLMEDAGYHFSKAHKSVHRLFVRRVHGYQVRSEAGEDIAEELKELLSRWLINHIQNEDADYAQAVSQNMMNLVDDKSEGGWLARSMKRFFHRGL